MLSFKLLESKTKKIKSEIYSSSFLIKDKIIFLNNEKVTM